MESNAIDICCSLQSGWKTLKRPLLFHFKMVNNNNIEDQRWTLLDDARFQTFFDSDGRLVKEHEFRKAVFKGERQVSM